VKRLLHGRSQVAYVFDQEVVLDDRTGDAHRVALLKCVQADGGRGHLTRDDDHGDAVHVGRGNASDRIGDAGTRSHQGHAHLACGPRIAICSMDGRLLVTHEYMLHLVLLVQGIVNIEDSSARVAPDELDLFFYERADQDFCAHELG